MKYILMLAAAMAANASPLHAVSPVNEGLPEFKGINMRAAGDLEVPPVTVPAVEEPSDYSDVIEDVLFDMPIENPNGTEYPIVFADEQNGVSVVATRRGYGDYDIDMGIEGSTAAFKVIKIRPDTYLIRAEEVNLTATRDFFGKKYKISGDIPTPLGETLEFNLKVDPNGVLIADEPGYSLAMSKERVSGKVDPRAFSKADAACLIALSMAIHRDMPEYDPSWVPYEPAPWIPQPVHQPGEHHGGAWHPKPGHHPQLPWFFPFPLPHNGHGGHDGHGGNGGDHDGPGDGHGGHDGPGDGHGGNGGGHDGPGDGHGGHDGPGDGHGGNGGPNDGGPWHGGGLPPGWHPNPDPSNPGPFPPGHGGGNGGSGNDNPGGHGGNGGPGNGGGHQLPPGWHPNPDPSNPGPFPPGHGGGNGGSGNDNPGGHGGNGGPGNGNPGGHGGNGGPIIVPGWNPNPHPSNPGPFPPQHPQQPQQPQHPHQPQQPQHPHQPQQPGHGGGIGSGNWGGGIGGHGGPQVIPGGFPKPPKPQPTVQPKPKPGVKPPPAWGHGLSGGDNL